MLSLLSREFGVSINELVAGERLVAEDFKKAADENLVTALDHSTFTLKEKQAFFKKKWRPGSIFPPLFSVQLHGSS